MTAYSVDSFREHARRILPGAIFDYLDGGAGAEVTMRRNVAAYRRYGLACALRTGGRDVDPSCELLGARLSMPIVLAPTGGLNIFWPRGEETVARAASAAGVLQAVSAGASTSLEDIAAASDAPKWFQVCIYKDWQLLRDLMTRARRAGYSGLCVTLDGGVIGRRERDLRNRLQFTVEFIARNSLDMVRHWRWTLRTLSSLPITLANFPGGDAEQRSIAAYLSALSEPSPTWSDLARIRAEWRGPLIAKAITHPADAARACEEGIDAIVVSNHGGRQFETGISTLELLPAVVEAVRGRIPVLIDGGISRGTDILKALALGASACMIGRAHLWGLAADGERGARAVLEILRTEIVQAMHFCGVGRPADLTAGHVVKLSWETS